MTDRMHMDDSTIRLALTDEPRRELADELAADLGVLIRATAQRRPLAVLGGRRLSGFDVPTRPIWRPALTIALVLAMLAAALLVGSRLLRPSLPANGLVVLGSDRAGLVVVDPGSGTATDLVPAWPANPSGRTNRSDLVAITPKGDQLAYVDVTAPGWRIPILELPSGTVMGEVVDDGRGVYPEWGIQWSTDGSLLVLAATVDGRGRVVAANPSTGRLTDIGSAAATSRDPAPSPVDGRVAFVQTASAFGDDYRLVVWDARTGEAAELFAGTGDGGSVAGTPAWAPDGRSIVVTVRREDGKYALLRLADDDSGQVLVSPWLDGWVSGAWSPDGSQLLAVVAPQGGRSADIYTNGDQRSELFLVEADGSGWRMLVERACANAAWSPDGESIVYERSSCEPRSETAELRIVDRDGTGDWLLWAGDARVTGRLSLAWQAVP